MVYQQTSAPQMTSPPGGGLYNHPGAMSPGLTYAQPPQQYQQPLYRTSGYRGRGGRGRGGSRPSQPITRNVSIVANRDIGLGNAPTGPRKAPRLSSRSPKIPTRARPHQVRPCTLYSNRGAQRTSGRERTWASDNL